MLELKLALKLFMGEPLRGLPPNGEEAIGVLLMERVAGERE